MLKQKIFGLDISDHSVEAVLLAKPFFGKPKVLAYARTILRGEVVKNGIVKKPEKLGENILKLLNSAQPRPIKTPFYLLSLPDSQVFTTIFKFPAGLRREEIKKTIPYKAEEIIPFKAAEIYFDFKTITKYNGTQEVFYAAVPKKIVDDYVKVLKSIGLVPIAFDLESISLARALISSQKKSDQATLLMDIGARTTDLNIFDRNGIRQGLAIQMAGSRFTKSIAKSLGISEKEADQLKMKVGFDPQQKQGRVVLILQKELRRIIAETKKLINYYQDEVGRQVSLVILAGGSSLLPKIDKYLSDNLGLEVKLGNPLLKISDPKKLIQFKGKAILFANVIGLGLRAITKKPLVGDINLLPIEKRFKFAPEKGEKKAWQLIYFRLAIFILFILVFAGILVLKNQGFDFYQRVYPSPEYETFFSSDIDLEVLEELREHFLIPEPTTTPTTTEGIIEIVTKVKIKPTGLGYLNVREGPGTNYSKIGQAPAGQEYDLIDEQDDWYQIQFDERTTGWVYSIYVEKLE